MSSRAARTWVYGVGENRLTVPPRPRFARPVLALPTMDDDDYGNSEAETSVLAIQDTYHRDPTQRGLTCYVCFRTGHAWLDCPCLKHLSAKEREDMAYRRRVYFEKKNPRDRLLRGRDRDGSAPPGSSDRRTRGSKRRLPLRNYYLARKTSQSLPVSSDAGRD
jgi:hypothetical protein